MRPAGLVQALRPEALGGRPGQGCTLRALCSLVPRLASLPSAATCAAALTWAFPPFVTPFTSSIPLRNEKNPVPNGDRVFGVQTAQGNDKTQLVVTGLSRAYLRYCMYRSGHPCWCPWCCYCSADVVFQNHFTAVDQNRGCQPPKNCHSHTCHI